MKITGVKMSFENVHNNNNVLKFNIFFKIIFIDEGSLLLGQHFNCSDSINMCAY